MAWPTRSKLLSINKTTNHNAATRINLFGPAAGHTWLVKTVAFANQSGVGTKTFYLYVERAGVVYMLLTASCAPATADARTVNFVAEAGDTFSFNINTAIVGDITCSLHGALLG